MNSPLVKFGNTVREIRKQQGLSQEDLADLCGLHRTYIGGIERGERNISLLNILHLSKALKSTPCDLLREFSEIMLKKMDEELND